MHITLSPMRRDDQLTLLRSGDVLTINGTDFDFTDVPDGAVLPREAVACKWLASDVERIAGQLSLTLILPHACSAPEQTLRPSPLRVDSDGPIVLPPYQSPSQPETGS